MEVGDDEKIDLALAGVEVGENRGANRFEVCVQLAQKTGFVARERGADE